MLDYLKDQRFSVGTKIYFTKQNEYEYIILEFTIVSVSKRTTINLETLEETETRYMYEALDSEGRVHHLHNAYQVRSGHLTLESAKAHILHELKNDLSAAEDNVDYYILACENTSKALDKFTTVG